MIDIKLLKNGDNILVHSKGLSPTSIAIRELTESYWNHASKFYWEGDNGVVVEALFGGVVITSIEKYLNEKKFDIKVVRLRPEAFKNEQEYEDGLQTARMRIYNQVGKKYDFGAITWLAMKYLWKTSWKKAKKYIRFNPFESREKFFCSELVCQADYEISSLYPFLYRGNTKSKCDTTTPRDIAKSKNCEYILGVDLI